MSESQRIVDVRDMVSAAVRLGPWPVVALRDELYEAGVTEWELSQAVAGAKRAGDLAVFQVRYWAHPSFLKDGCAPRLWVEGHSRKQLIARLSDRAMPPRAQGTAIERMMQGDDAERLAREDFARGVTKRRNK